MLGRLCLCAASPQACGTQHGGRPLPAGPPPFFAAMRPIAIALAGEELRQQLDVPIEIIAPALVQIIGRKRAAVLLELPARRPDRLTLEMHVRLDRRAPALLQVARRAGGRDIL